MHNLKYKNLKFKHLIDEKAISFLSFGKFASIEGIRKKGNPIVDLSKFTFNKKILSGVVIMDYKLEYERLISMNHLK